MEENVATVMLVVIAPLTGWRSWPVPLTTRLLLLSEAAGLLSLGGATGLAAAHAEVIAGVLKKMDDAEYSGIHQA